MTSAGFANDGFRIGWDSTTIRAFKKCPRYYQLTMLEGWRPKHTSAALHFGTFMHRGMEVFDKAIVAGKTKDEALRDALRNVLILSEGLLPNTDDKRSREALARAIVWYPEAYDTAQIKTLTVLNSAGEAKAAVELSFRIVLPFKTDSGHSLFLCGHIDRLGEFVGTEFVLDRKSTASGIGPDYFTKFQNDAQMIGYYIAAKLIFSKKIQGVIIDAAYLLADGVEFSRGTCIFSDDVAKEYLDDLQTFLVFAEACHKMKYYPMNRSSCALYGGCEFLPICTKPPSSRNLFLDANYSKNEPWDPTKSREE